MANPQLYPNMPDRQLEEYFERALPWFPNCGSAIYEATKPEPEEEPEP